MPKKKILYVITLAERGGAQKYVLDLAKNLDKGRYEILVACGGKLSEWLFVNLEKEKIDYYPLKHLKREILPWHDFLGLFELRKLIKLFKPDIVHLNSSKAGVIGSFAAVGMKRIKIIYTAHGFVFNEPMNFFKKFIYLWTERISGGLKNKIIAISKFDEEVGIKNKIAPKEKFATISTGIDPKAINFLSKDEARKKLNVPSKYKIVGTIANYYATKALHRLIEASKIISGKCNDCKFILIGDGPERKKLEKLIEDNKLTNNFFLGPLDNASAYLKAFDVFILPSVKEGMPYTILEAMLAEVPIVATKVGGIPEMIIDGKNGFLVKSKTGKEESITINQIAEKTAYYLSHPKIAEIFANSAYKKLTADFTLEKMVQETEKIYS